MLTTDQRGHKYTYGGHRRKSYIVSDNAELVELRARLRTYDAGYSRATMLTLGSSVLYLKLFDERFYNIGILYAVLAGILSVLAYFRRKHSNRDFSDQVKRKFISPNSDSGRIFGGPFATAGWIVIFVTGTVAASHVILLVLILRV